MSRFGFIELNSVQILIVKNMRKRFERIAEDLDSLLDDSRYHAACLKSLEEASMWFSKAISTGRKYRHPAVAKAKEKTHDDDGWALKNPPWTWTCPHCGINAYGSFADQEQCFAHQCCGGSDRDSFGAGCHKYYLVRK